jgi:hypothetical protein
VGKELLSFLMPTIAVKGKPKSSLRVNLLPVEVLENGLGLVFLSLLEMIGSTNPVFPFYDDIEEQLVQFLRSDSSMNNKSHVRMGAMYALPVHFPTSATGNISVEWPAYRGLVGEGSAVPRLASG